MTTIHNEPIDEAREPAREYHASPEVPMGVGSLGRTSAGAVTQAVQHEERGPPEREQVVASSWRQTNETREPVKEPLAHADASIRDNSSDLTLGGNTSMGNLTTNRTKESSHHLNQRREQHRSSQSSKPSSTRVLAAWGSGLNTRQQGESADAGMGMEDG